MDPFSITAGVVGVTDAVCKLGGAVSRFRDDYKLADEDLDVARQHALLLKEEIQALEARRAANYVPHAKGLKVRPDMAKTSEETSFEKAISTARELLASIDESAPLRSEPHTWRSKVRWAMKDKQVLAKLNERLKSAESTLQGIAAMEQIRLSHRIYGMLLQQQSTLDKIENGGLLTSNNIVNATLVSQTVQQPLSLLSQPTASKSELAASKKSVTKFQKKQQPWTYLFDQRGISAQLVSLPYEKGTVYRAALHISLFDKMFSTHLQFSQSVFSFDRMLHVRNIVPSNAPMTIACQLGDFSTVRSLLQDGVASGSDVTPEGLPMLECAIGSGSARLVSLLLEHGAEPDLAYGDHSMTALQSAFLRGRLDIARMLLMKGADIEYVDNDGYSALSYLWVVDKPLVNANDFMRLCLANEFSEVNSCDSRGWSAFHRAAAIGTSEDVETFLQLGASLDLRANWYGWTALFFAASHDNMATFKTLVSHSQSDVYESLDGDGWTLLHCCIYFGATSVMREVLRNGLDVNQLTHPAPLPEDPDLSYRELTPSDIALYIGPNRFRSFMDALIETGRYKDLQDNDDVFWDANPKELAEASQGAGNPNPIYGAEDVDDDRWTLLHWASYNGSPKVKRLLLLKGVEAEHQEAIELEENPTVLPSSPLAGRL